MKIKTAFPFHLSRINMIITNNNVIKKFKKMEFIFEFLLFNQGKKKRKTFKKYSLDLAFVVLIQHC